MNVLNRLQAHLLIDSHGGFYAYGLYRMDTGTVFYVGKGTKYRVFAHLARTKNIANKRKTAIIEEIGVSNVAFLIWPAETEKDAFRLEAEKIALYKDTVCNYTKGGSGKWSYSDIEKAELKKKAQGRKPDMRAVLEGWTPEKRAAQSALQKTITRKYSKESREKLRCRRGIKDSNETKEKKRASWTPERRAAQAERARLIVSKLTEAQLQDRVSRMKGNAYYKNIKNRAISDETREKQRIARIGTHLSQKTKDKLTQTSKIASLKRKRNANGTFT